MAEQIIVDLTAVYFGTGTAKLSNLPAYINNAQCLAGNGNDVVITGPAPVWFYLKIAHALHGKSRKLIYRSPVTGDVIIFDHSPD